MTKISDSETKLKTLLETIARLQEKKLKLMFQFTSNYHYRVTAAISNWTLLTTIILSLERCFPSLPKNSITSNQPQSWRENEDHKSGSYRQQQLCNNCATTVQQIFFSLWECKAENKHRYQREHVRERGKTNL